MKKISFLSFLIVLVSTTAFATPVIYQENNGKNSCIVAYTHANEFDQYDIYSPPDSSGNSEHAMLTINSGGATLMGHSWKSFCSQGATANNSTDHISAQCAEVGEGRMVIQFDGDDFITTARFVSPQLSIACNDLKKI